MNKNKYKYLGIIITLIFITLLFFGHRVSFDIYTITPLWVVGLLHIIFGFGKFIPNKLSEKSIKLSTISLILGVTIVWTVRLIAISIPDPFDDISTSHFTDFLTVPIYYSGVLYGFIAMILQIGAFSKK